MPKGAEQDQVMMVEQPLVIMFVEPETEKLVCHLHPLDGYDHRAYGIVVCDLVRNVADAFGVKEDKVWEWVDKERARPTSDINHPKGYGKPWSSRKN